MTTTGACHCGEVVMRVTRCPTEVYECSCSICQKSGVLWAYYSRDEITLESGAESTRVYTWNQHWIEFHSCATCGCTTHWVPTDPTVRDRMGVNARLIESVVPGRVELKYFDGGDNNCFWTRRESGVQTNQPT